VPHDLPRVLAGTNGVSPRQGSQGTQRIEFGGRNLQPLPAFLQGCSCLASCALQKVIDTLPPLTQQPVGLGQGGTLYEQPEPIAMVRDTPLEGEAPPAHEIG